MENEVITFNGYKINIIIVIHKERINMKDNKGITLIAVMIYLIVLAVAIALISNFTRYFYNNTDEIIIDDKTATQYAKFMSYIIDDMNSGNVTDLTVKKSGSDIFLNLYFEDQTIHQYIYQGNKISLVREEFNPSTDTYTNTKKIVLCSNISSCSITKESERCLLINANINSTVYTNKLYL